MEDEKQKKKNVTLILFFLFWKIFLKIFKLLLINALSKLKTA